MRIYFLSPVFAALKIGGVYVGILDKNEQFMDIDLNDGIFCEIIPADGRMLAVNFIANRELFESPPDYLEVYDLKTCYKIVVKNFLSPPLKLEVAYQKRVGAFDTLVTHFCEQGARLMLENTRGFCYEELPVNFKLKDCYALSAYREDFIVVEGCASEDALLIFLEKKPELVFKSKCDGYKFDKELVTTINFYDILKHRGRCVWEFDGEFKMREYSVERSKDIDIAQIDQRLLPYCFFEEILAGGDAEFFLCEHLKKRAKDLQSYLGLFVEVIVPPPGLDQQGVGLVYRDGENKYSAKYFKTEMKDRLITNILPLA